MTIRFLIDECLSPELVQRAVQAGYPESSCVRDRGLTGTQDWKLIEHVVAGDWTLVTHNAIDFRGGGPDRLAGEHAKQPIHAGLVCLGSVYPLDLLRQHALFQMALNQVAELEDLVNTALEVFENEDGSVDMLIYDIPDPT